MGKVRDFWHSLWAPYPTDGMLFVFIVALGVATVALTVAALRP